jgi:hypothetical protein
MFVLSELMNYLFKYLFTNKIALICNKFDIIRFNKITFLQKII